MPEIQSTRLMCVCLCVQTSLCLHVQLSCTTFRYCCQYNIHFVKSRTCAPLFCAHYYDCAFTLKAEKKSAYGHKKVCMHNAIPFIYYFNVSRMCARSRMHTNAIIPFTLQSRSLARSLARSVASTKIYSYAHVHWQLTIHQTKSIR